jgi:putative peptide zinc metalloprotease protein
VTSPARGGRLIAATGADEAAAALASRRAPRTDRPRLGPQLIIRRIVRMGEVQWVVKNPELDAYYTFSDDEWGVIELFDGTRTVSEAAAEYNRRVPSATPVDAGFILEYLDMLRGISLIEQSGAEKSLELYARTRAARKRAAEAKAEGFNPFFIQFHVLDPDRFLNKTVKYVRWIWSPPVVVFWSLAVLWTVGIFVQHWAPIWNGTYELYAFLRKPLIDAIQFFLILCFIGGIHEFGHAYATKIFGGDVHDIGLALLYFTPAFYCDTTDSILFESKWHRLWTTTAGIYVEGFICAGATALWVVTYPDTIWNELAYKTMLFTGVSTIFFNINPLIKIDGYYALSSLLEMPELREESLRYIGAWVQRRVLRLSIDLPAATRRKRRIYWIYGSLALAYQVVMIRFIGGLFYNLFNRYFPDIAIVLLSITLYRIFRKRVRLVTRTARLFYLDKKELLMSRRSRKVLVTAGVAVAILLLVPFSRRTVTAEAAVRPVGVVHVDAPVDGVVARVAVKEADAVSPGAELLRMVSPELRAETAHYAAELDRMAGAEAAARQLGEADGVAQAAGRRKAAAAGLEDAAAQENRLAVKSPITGRVLTARPADLEGHFVKAGTPLLEIGNCSKLVAELPVSERLLDDLAPGAPVRALFGQRPTRPVVGKIVRVSPATLDQPPTLHGLTDPSLPSSKPDRFVAFAVFDNPDGSLRPGDGVRAKIYAARSSVVSRTWRVLRRWFQTVVW